jgi:hypothetical protein
MKDMLGRLEKLRNDADDCDLISKLATDPYKRQTFAKLAGDYREMAATLETIIKGAQEGTSST